MTKIIWKKFSGGSYYSDDVSDKNTDMLRIFLNDISTIGCDATIFKDKLAKEKVGFGTNVCDLDLEDGVVTLRYIFSEDPDYLKISVEELIKVIEQWEVLCNKQVETILVTHENNKFNLEEYTS